MSHEQWCLRNERPEDSRVYITTLGGNVFVTRLECRTRLFDKSSPTGLHDWGPLRFGLTSLGYK